MEEKVFPNGFESWHETHFEIVTAIQAFLVDDEAFWPPVIQAVQNMEGIGGMYELARDLTDKFENQNAGKNWDGEYFDTIQEFINKEFNTEKS
jgi:hypothetical protein